MDPNANLREQLQLAKEIIDNDANEESAARLAELVLALDEWLIGQGFLPKRWERKS